MPHRISRKRAIASLSPSACFICELNAAGSPYLLARENGVAVFLSRYPRFWGQILITSLTHHEKFTHLEEATWLTMNLAALKAARLLERRFAPARCYIASLGSVCPLPMTCPHLHLNVIPVPSADLKPAEVLTWQHGLYDGTPEEWQSLQADLQRDWKEAL